jgi:hypothetical protein
MTFGRGGNYLTWARSGWSTPGSDITWIDGYQATLEFAMPAPEVDQLLGIVAIPLQSSVTQRMLVYFNGFFVGLIVRQIGMEESLFPIAREYWNPGRSRNTLVFVCPNAIKPADVGEGPDQRTLSFALSLLSLYSAE